MNKAKKLMTAFLVTALMVPSMAVSAATPSVQKTDIDGKNTTISVVASNAVTYSGTAQKVGVTLIVDGKTLKEGTDYIIEIPKVTDAGTYNLKAKITGIGHYSGTFETTVTVVVNKKAQKLTKTKAKKTKASKLKVKAVKIKLKVKATGKGKIKYKRVSKNLKVNKKGKVTIKKGTKKGTYYVKVRAKGNKNYKATKWKRIKIKVK